MVKKLIEISNNFRTISANNIKASYNLESSNYALKELKCVFLMHAV